MYCNENDYFCLARYPHPECFIHDNGGAFTSISFLHILVLNGIKDDVTHDYSQESTSSFFL